MALELAKRLSSSELKKERARLTRELAADYRRKAREEVERLKAELRAARRARREAMAEVRERCRDERRAVRARIKEERTRARLAINAERDRELEAAAGACQLRRAAAEAEALEVIQADADALRAAQRSRRDVARADARAAAKGRQKRSRAESRAESDDAVRANLPPDLVAVFDHVRSRIKGGPRRSRTEAFLEWAEEHPGDVLAIQSHQAERDVERLIREHQAEERRLAKARRRVPREVRQAVDEAVPF